MSDFKEPTTSLEEQLRIVSTYDESDDGAALAKAIDYAGIALRFLEVFGFPRPFVYPFDATVVAEWPGEWDVSLHIDGAGELWAHALRGEEVREQTFVGEGVLPALCDFMQPVLTFKPIANRFGEVLR